MIENFNDILNKLEKKQYAPVYFLTGDEPYFIDYITDYIAKNVLNESERHFNQTIVYGKETTVSNIVEAALRYPMLAPYNIIIVKEAQELKNPEELTSYIENPNPTSFLVLCYKYKTIDGRTKFHKTLTSRTCYFESKRIPESRLQGFIDNYLKERNARIIPSASAMMIEYLGNKLNRISSELDKILINKKQGESIDDNDVQNHVGISKEYNVFELQKALAFKDFKKATKIFNFIKANPKAAPMPMMVSLLFTFFSRLYALQFSGKHFDEAFRELSIPPFLKEENQRALHVYSGKLEKVISLFKEYDLRSKGVNDRGTDQMELAQELIFRILLA